MLKVSDIQVQLASHTILSLTSETKCMNLNFSSVNSVADPVRPQMQAILTELLGEALGPIYQMWKCAVAPSPSSYWLSLYQCGWLNSGRPVLDHSLNQAHSAPVCFASGVLWPTIWKALTVYGGPHLCTGYIIICWRDPFIPGIVVYCAIKEQGLYI